LPIGSHVELDTDEHKAYPQALKRLLGRAVSHRTTSSKAHRTPRNPLFPANLGDLLIRHTGANQKRETIAFSKRRQGALYRIAIWAAVRNYVRPTSVKRKHPPPGVAIGILPRAMTISELFGERCFPWRVDLTGWLEDCYFARIPTRRMARCRKHELSYAV
jgi:hypothetical protein